MILICGGLADIMTELVCARIKSMGLPYRLLDLGTYPEGYTVDWRWEKSTPRGRIAGNGWSLDLEQITGIYVRYLGEEGHIPVQGVPPTLAASMLHESQAGLTALIDSLPCLVANRSTPSMSNHSKPYQALAIRESGLHTPHTLITTDPDAARAFCDARRGEVVFKSISGIRSIVRRVRDTDMDRLAYVRNGPVQFQEYVPGDNVRVHTVGHELFATRIRSGAVDYRYARQQGSGVEMEPVDLPEEIAQACFQISTDAGLVIAGIDLKQTPENQYYCLEVNPSPGFAWYEQMTGQPISAALAAVLHRGTIEKVHAVV